MLPYDYQLTLICESVSLLSSFINRQGTELPLTESGELAPVLEQCQVTVPQLKQLMSENKQEEE